MVLGSPETRSRTSVPVAVAATLLLACSSTVAAQSLKLEFRNGVVDLKAENVTVRAILDAWSRIGGTRIVGGDRVAGSPVTLALTGVPEKQALEVLLRNVAGYVVGERRTSRGASRFESIRITAIPQASPSRADSVVVDKATGAPSARSNGASTTTDEPQPAAQPDRPQIVDAATGAASDRAEAPVEAAPVQPDDAGSTVSNGATGAPSRRTKTP
jgi:hypothetical protein